MTALDPVDVRILQVLQESGRISNVDLSDRVHLSETPCLRRVRRLEDAGVIGRYAAVLDPRKIGLGVMAFVQVNLHSHTDADTEAFRAAVIAHPEVVACWVMTGTFGFLLQVMAVDMDSYADFAMRRLMKLPGVKDFSSSFVLQEVKPPSSLPLTHLRMGGTAPDRAV